MASYITWQAVTQGADYIRESAEFTTESMHSDVLPVAAAAAAAAEAALPAALAAAAAAELASKCLAGCPADRQTDHQVTAAK